MRGVGIVFFGPGAEDEPPRRTLRHLVPLVRDAIALVWRAGRREFAVAAALQVLGGLGVAAQLLLAKQVLDTVLAADRSGESLRGALPGLLLLIGVTGLVTAASVVRTEQQRLLGELARREAQNRVLDVATAVDLEAFETPSFLDRLQRAQQGGQWRPLQIVNGLLGMINGVVGLISVGAVLVVIAPLLAAIVLLAYVPLWLVSTRNSRAFYRFFRRTTKMERRLAYLWFLMTGKDPAKELRAFDLGPFLVDRHRELYDARLVELRRLVAQRIRLSLVASLASPAFVGGALVYLLVSGRMDLAQVAIAGWGVFQFGSRLQSIAWGAGSLYESALFVDDFTQFAALKPELDARRPHGVAPAGFERMVVDDVSFAYPGSDRLALSGVSLQIARGEVVALVGENGSGKTTLAKLLCALYRPRSGRILWDGVDLADVSPTELRRSIAVIFQDFIHYEFPARDNVAMGNLARIADLGAIEAAAREAGAHDFIAALPHGYETLLSRQFEEDGKDLSVGQWQLVALARAFFRDAPFLILDEPTAALDARAEHALFERIRTLAHGRSVLLISHRFSSVRSADRIFVLRHGELVEQGDHDALMRLGGLYAELFTLQAAAYADGAARASGPVATPIVRRA
jgi:ATP-binding cassette, subfamily B, bacterial